MGLLKGVGILAGIAGAGVVLFARKRSAATGKDIAAIMSDLPAELKQAGGELKQRLQESIGIARQAAAEREAEIDREIAAAEARLEEAAWIPPEPQGADESFNQR